LSEDHSNKESIAKQIEEAKSRVDGLNSQLKQVKHEKALEQQAAEDLKDEKKRKQKELNEVSNNSVVDKERDAKLMEKELDSKNSELAKLEQLIREKRAEPLIAHQTQDVVTSVV
jgi:predicted nuclease with TOPRIM domain